jgi:hypothetical protein
VLGGSGTGKNGAVDCRFGADDGSIGAEKRQEWWEMWVWRGMVGE